MTGYPNARSDRRYRHDWQVVRTHYLDGWKHALSSHRWEAVALVVAHVRNQFEKNPMCAYAVRRTPGASS